MQLTMTARHMDVTEGMKTHIEERLDKSKFFELALDTHIVLSVEKHRQQCELTVKGEGFTHVASEETHDMYQAIDGAFSKMEKQLRKERELFKKRRTLQKRQKVSERQEVVSEPEPDGGMVSAKGRKIVSTQGFAAKPMSLDEAVDQIEVEEPDFLVFRNATTGQVNVLFFREDDHLGLIEPSF